MEKRVLIAVILSMGILFLYPYFIQRFYPPKAPVQTTQKPIQAAPAPGSPAAAKAAPLIIPPAPAEELSTVETPVFRAVFTSAGGGVKSFELKRYREALKADAPVENLTKSVAAPGSFTTGITSNGVSENILFRPSSSAVAVKEGASNSLTFTGTTASGLRVEKKYTFTAGSYLVRTDINVVNAASNQFSGRADITLVSNLSGKDSSGYHTGPVIDTKDKLLRQTEKEPQKTGAEKLRWIGLENKYFLSAVIPRTDTQVAWTASIPAEKSSAVTVQVPLNLAPGAQAAYSYDTFLGPKEYDLLVAQKIGLEEAIEFGWFGFMAKPLLVVLNFFQRYMGNYGIAIIIITVIIKVLFYPLTKHSLQSMKEMQKIQPQLAALKEKYKDNKEKLNREMMELYKRYKINPVGGCLPMLLQIPVFIALYEVLYVAIELRHAPLFLWIKDLSDKDPYYITPIVMGATMFIQQKMTPSTVDPSQAKIMLIMPIIFTFMFLNFPSGLVVYWLVNNVLSIAQQYYIQRTPSAAKA